MADAQLPVEKIMQLEPISEPPVSPDEVQQIDFSGEVNAILEEKMQLNPQITSNGSSNEQKQLKLPANTSIAIPEEKQVTLIAANNTTSSNMTSNNVTLVEKRPIQSTNKKTNSDIYSISINNIKQIAYKGWPLYHYINDTMPEDAKGQGIDGAWFVVDPRNFPPR